MTTYDIVMLLIVVGMAIQGAWRGLAWQVAPVASLILGYMVAGPVSPSLAPLFGDPPLADVLALIAVYVAVSLAVYLMIRSVKESLEKLKLAEFDKHLGFLLGAIKGVILTVVVTVLLITVSPAARQMILQTESHSIARLIIGEALPLMPETFRNTL
jgi:membrane protein required for colicin V production